MTVRKKQNNLPKCIVCKKDNLRKVNKDEVTCDNCKSQYPFALLPKAKKARK